MAQSARMRCPFSALGLTAEACSTYTFPRLLGPQAAAQFLLGAEWWTSEQCKATGLVLDVLPDEGFLAEVLTRAEKLAAWPLDSLIETKGLLMAPHRDAMKAANKNEKAALARLRGGPANREALTAFREKREPNFAALAAARS
jgi:enoyl-CoA hydratase/carnithine racemase